jgi:hypothetical protein
MEQLKSYRNWVVAYLHDKIPLNPYTMQRADVIHDPYSWADYATADACVQLHNGLVLGFVLTNTPYSAVDLDTYKTTDPQVKAKHQSIYEKLNSYAELSPNGGCHILVEAKLEQNRKLPNEYIELITQGYVTITKNVLNFELINPRQLQLNELYYYILEKQNKINPMVPDNVPETQSDDDVIKAAGDALNGELFKKLFEGKLSELNYQSQSEADQALVDIIAFYTNSKTQVGRIFHRSELGKRGKANRKDYLYHPKYGIITRSFDQKKPPVYYENIELIIKDKVHEEQKKAIAIQIIEPTPNGNNGYHSKLIQLPDFVQKDVLQFDYEPPPGFLGQIAQFIFANAVHPVREVATAAAIAFLSGICGREYNISNTGLNHYIVVLAPTGGGKEGAADGISRLTSYVQEKAPLIEQFVGPADIVSPQALIKHLATVSPCFLSHKGEMGLWMQKLTDKYAHANETGMRQILLDLFMKSGAQSTFRGAIYSDKAKNVPSVRAPAFTLFGDATPDTFYKSVNEENVEEGFINRFCVVECDMEERPVFNEAHGTIEPDAQMITFISQLIKKVVNMQLSTEKEAQTVQITQTPDAYKAQMEFLDECTRKSYEFHDTAEGKIYSRAHLRVLRLAGLVAVGMAASCPVVTAEAIEWARKFIVNGIANVTWRFQQGEIGTKASYLEQRKTVHQFLFKYWTNGWSEKLQKEFAISKQMFDAKLVTRRYLQQHLMTYAAFRNARNPRWEFDSALKELVECGTLFAVDMGKIRESGRLGTAYYITDYEALKDQVRGRSRKRQKRLEESSDLPGVE